LSSPTSILITFTTTYSTATLIAIAGLIVNIVSALLLGKGTVMGTIMTVMAIPITDTITT
jgi:Co/Zn/Cd efflux system component